MSDAEDLRCLTITPRTGAVRSKASGRLSLVDQPVEENGQVMHVVELLRLYLELELSTDHKRLGGAARHHPASRGRGAGMGRAARLPRGGRDGRSAVQHFGAGVGATSG